MIGRNAPEDGRNDYGQTLFHMRPAAFYGGGTMRKMRWLSLAICLGMVFSLAACTGTEDQEKPDPNPPGGGTGTEERPEGTLTVDDVYVWTGYPAVEFFPEFSVASEAEPITYEYDNTYIEVDGENNLISSKAETAGRTVVTAKSEHFSTEFNVYYSPVDKSGSWYDTSAYVSYAQTLSRLCAQEGTDGRTTVFLGDSFFDTRYFWTNFDSYYEGMDALCCGISSTTSYDWETLASVVLGDLVPANIAIHIGTNNFYDDHMDHIETTAALQRLFLVLHDLYPETNIYYFSITQRLDSSYATMVDITNADMQAWCEGRDWITWLDTSSELTVDKLKDGIHPKLENYNVFTEALEEARMPLYLK